MVRESGDLTQQQDVSLAPIWDDPILEKHFQAHQSSVLSLSYNHDGSQLASGSKDGQLKIWNFKPQMNSYVFKDSENPINSVCFSPCGKLLASTSRSYVRLRTPERTSEYWTLRAHVLSIRHVHFSYDSEMLATCGDDKTTKVWGIKHFNHKFAYSLIGHNNWVRCIKFSPDANTLVSCSDDSTVKIWDLRSKQCVLSLDGHVGSVKSVDYHPTGYYVASAGMDKTVRIFDLRLKRAMQLHKMSMGSANSVHYQRTGQYIACAVSDGTLKIYDLAQAKMLYTLHGHVNSVNFVQFTKGGDYLCSGDSSGKILLWRTNFRQTSSDSIVSPKTVLLGSNPKSFSEESQEKLMNKKHSVLLSTHRPTRRTKSADNTPSSNRRPAKTTASSYTPLGSGSKPSSSPLSSSSNRELVKHIENAVHDIVRQISLLADSISILERRLSRTEQDVKDIKEIINK